MRRWLELILAVAAGLFILGAVTIAALTAEAHAVSERGQTVTRSAGSTNGRPRGKTIETGESWSTQVPPIVSLPHPGITQTESICVDPIVALTGRSRFRDHGLTGLGVIESGIA